MLTGVSGRPRAEPAGDGLGRPQPHTWRTRRRWPVAAIAAGVVLLFYCARREAGQLGTQSDGAAMVLESWAMLHGNLLLHGWHLSDVTFYTTELPEYMLVETVIGLHTDVVQICAALTYTLLVVLAATVAYGARSADSRTAAVRAGIAVAVMVGPTVAAASVLLNDPDHTGTAVPVLFALLVLDRGPRRWWVPVVVAAVLGWALVGDSLVMLIGVAPLVVVGGVRSLGRLALRGARFAVVRYDLSLAAAGLAAAVGGTALGRLISAGGGFAPSPRAKQHIAASAALPKNASATAENFLRLFSADFFGAGLNGWLAVTAVHLVFAGLVAGAIVLALRAFRRDPLHGDLIAQLLAVAIVINLLAYLLLYPGTVLTAREIAPVFGLGGALAGRVLGEPLLRRRLAPLLVLGAVAAVIALVPPLVTVKPTGPAAASLARFLEAHHLRNGLAGYWNADSTTLDSGGRVIIAPVTFSPGRGLGAYLREIDAGLFDRQAHAVNFLVATAPGPPAAASAAAAVTPAEAVAAFGQPYQRYDYQGYMVMVWRKNLLRQLESSGKRVRPAPGAEWTRHAPGGPREAGTALCLVCGSSSSRARYFLIVHESGQSQLAVTAPVDEGQTRPARWTAAWRLVTVVAVAGLTIGLFWAYLLQSRTEAVNSDAAGMVLQGWDMLHGNPLLRGWVMADVSFYTFEIPLDGLISVVHGLQADVVHVSAAIEYALLVLFAALLAAGAGRDRRRGRGEAWVRALIAAGIMVAPGAAPGAHVLLLAPDHTGIGVPVLATLVLVDRVRPRRLLPVLATALLVGLLLIWAQLDDPVAEFGCALPLALACAAPLAAVPVRRLAGRIDARPGRSEAAQRGYDIALVAAAVASYELTRLAVRAINRAGGFYLRPIPGGATLSHLGSQVGTLGQNLMYLFGANFWVRPQPLTAFAYLHLVGVAVALLGLLIAGWSWPRADRVTRALVLAVLVMLAAGALSPLTQPISGAHEIAIVLPLSAALAGRGIGPWLAAAAPTARAARAARMAAACVLVVAGAGYLSNLGYNAAQRSNPSVNQALADWLVAHKLTSGIGGYWDANVTALASGGAVRMAPVTDGAAYGYLWVAKPAWFDPKVSSANFIIAHVQQLGAGYVYVNAAIDRYGKPAEEYHFGRTVVLVYHRNLLQSVIPPVISSLSVPPAS